jgi:hypothetical protein
MFYYLLKENSLKIHEKLSFHNFRIRKKTFFSEWLYADGPVLLVFVGDAFINFPLLLSRSVFI